jgi:uncharacterized protein YndB with AHSA1/START domain
MPAQKETSVTTQVNEIYIRATAEAIWNAITRPEWTEKYGYRTRAEFDLKPGGKHRHQSTAQMVSMGIPETCIDGEVIEAIPPRKLVHSWRFLFFPEDKAEGFTRVTWEIEPTSKGFCRLTVTHELTGAPRMAANTSGHYDDQGGGGWLWILSDLKSLLETGKTLAP